MNEKSDVIVSIVDVTDREKLMDPKSVEVPKKDEGQFVGIKDIDPLKKYQSKRCRFCNFNVARTNESDDGWEKKIFCSLGCKKNFHRLKWLFEHGNLRKYFITDYKRVKQLKRCYLCFHKLEIRRKNGKIKIFCGMDCGRKFNYMKRKLLMHDNWYFEKLFSLKNR